MTRILHVIERLTLGGAGRALIAGAGHSIATTGTAHRILSLRDPHPAAAARAEGAGLTLVTPDERDPAITAADILHLHFWNTPELHAFLRLPLPPCRIVLTSHVAGSTPPHILTDEVIALADLVLLTAPDLLEAAGDLLRARATIAPSPADFTRLAGIAATPHPGLNIGYVGAVDFAKMHPRFVALHADAARRGARIIVCGEGGAARTLTAEAAALGLAGSFDVRGHVEDIAGIFSTLDIFGYPLCEGNYATTELVLHEAQYAGVPCVVLARGGAAHAVIDGETGFVVASEADYTERIARLGADPQLRRRMGKAAAVHARSSFGAANLAPLIDAAYARALRLPRRDRPGTPLADGAEAFLASLGAHAEPFRASLSGDADADARITAAHPALTSADAGGALHYRLCYPEDPALRFWAGLVLLGQRRPALAAAEFHAAARLGFDPGRAARRLQAARDEAG